MVFKVHFPFQVNVKRRNKHIASHFAKFYIEFPSLDYAFILILKLLIVKGSNSVCVFFVIIQGAWRLFTIHFNSIETQFVSNRI